MKRNLFFSVTLIAILTLSFVACETGGGGGMNCGNPGGPADLEPITTFAAVTDSGTVTIDIFGEDPARAIARAYFYVIRLDDTVIGRGILIKIGSNWIFQPSYGATESFPSVFLNSVLIIPNIPYSEGSITGFVAHEDGDGTIGETLILSGQVWTIDLAEDDLGWEHFTGNRTIPSASFWVSDDVGDIDIGGEGAIIDGVLSFLIATPSELVSVNYVFDDYWEELFTNFNISPASAQVAAIDYMIVTGGGTGELAKRWIGSSGNNIIWEEVIYIYVDRNVTVSGVGIEEDFDCECDDCDCEEFDGQCYCYGSIITNDFNLSFQTGWNPITVTIALDLNNQTETITLSAGVPTRARWILDEWGGHSLNIRGITENVMPDNNNARSFLRSRR